MIYLLLLGYGLIILYLVFAAVRWVKCLLPARFYIAGKTCVILVHLVAALPGPVAFFMENGNLQAALQKFHNCWLGIIIYYVMFAVLVELGRLVLKKIRKFPEDTICLRKWAAAVGIGFAVLVICVSSYGIIHAKKIYVNRYQINIDKEIQGRKQLKVALVADLHLGYSVGLDRIQDMVTKINECNPDLIIIAGDMFDNNYDAVQNPERIIEELKKLDSTLGTYAVYGNHDINEKLFCGFSTADSSKAVRDQKEDSFMEQAGIVVLKDEGICIADQFYLIGRLDAQKSGDGKNHRKTIDELLNGVDRKKPVLVIDHQPREQEEMAEAGVDVQFSGHTHAGQFFPINIGCHIIWDNAWGIEKEKAMYSVVTSGIGVYGPDMRIGTDSEVMEITISFQ